MNHFFSGGGRLCVLSLMPFFVCLYYPQIFNDYFMTIQLADACFLTCNLIWPLIMLVPFTEILVGQNEFYSLVKWRCSSFTCPFLLMLII